jgi:hypothetical protein
VISVRPDGGEEGQIAPALLLVVFVLLFVGLLLTQVGSAAEQKTQTQTAVDSAAVAATHQVRDFSIARAPLDLPWSFKAVFTPTAVAAPVPQVQAAACSAAQRNWSENSHGATAIDCAGSLFAQSNGDRVQVDLTAPAGQVVAGPAKVADQAAKADAVARVAFARCPVVGTEIQTAVASWILDQSLRSLGVSSACFTPDDTTLLDKLDEESLGAASALVGPPNPILDAVRQSVRVELVD